MSTVSSDSIQSRKSDHLRVCLEGGSGVESEGATGFQEVRFVHNALPEIATDEVDTSCRWMNYTLSFPFLISPMTGGSENGYGINRDLVRAAQEARVAVGTGSMRVLFQYPEVLHHFQLKKLAPDVPLLANIGAVQLKHHSCAEIVDMVRRLEADALSVHLNCGQELYQQHGDRDFTDLKAAIVRVAETAPFPVVVKETGFGIAPVTARWLLSHGVSAVDVAGAGGTNWIRVELQRADGASIPHDTTFSDWGLPTAYLLGALKKLFSEYSGRIIASGGIRSALDIAKALALGAGMTAAALPLVRVAVRAGSDGVVAYLAGLRRTLVSLMTLTSCRTIEHLRSRSLIVSPRFTDYVNQLIAHQDYADHG